MVRRAMGLAILWVSGLACSRADDAVELTRETAPPPTAVSPQVPPVARPVFALLGEDARLYATADEGAASFSPKERGADAVVVVEVDATGADDPRWVRLRPTEHRSTCGYPPLSLAEPVYALRSELLPTLRSTKIVEPPDRTRLELRPGVALHPTKTDGTFVVMTAEARAKITLDVAEVTGELPVEAFAREEPTAAAGGAGPAPPPRAIARPSHDSPLTVGKLAVHLSKKRPPELAEVEGDPSRARLETPCLVVVGKRPPDPIAAIGEPLRRLSDLPDHEALLGVLSAGAIDSGVFDAGVFDAGVFDAVGIAEGGLGGLGQIGGPGERPAPGEGYGVLGRGGGGRAEIGGGGSVKAPPVVRIGTALVTGGLARAAFRRAAGQRMASVRRCFTEGLGRDPKLSGRVMLSFEVRGDGTVAAVRSVAQSKAEPMGTNIRDEAMIACVVAAFASAAFPESEQPTSARVTFSFAP